MAEIASTATKERLRGKKTWQLDKHPLYDKDISVSWVNLLPRGIGTKHQRKYLVKSAKEALAALFDRSNRSLPYAPGTISVAFIKIQKLARFVARNGIWRFSKMELGDIIEFLKEVRSRDGDGAPSSRTIHSYLFLLHEMWIVRKKYTASLRFDIFASEEHVLAEIRTIGPRKWRPVDEEDALALIKDAMGWIENESPYLIEVIHDAWKHHLKLVGVSQNKYMVNVARYYASLDLDTRFHSIRKHIGLEEAAAHRVLSVAVGMTEGACIALLLFLVGFRISELARLDVDCVDRSNAIPTIRGIAAKKGGMNRSWTAASPIPEIIDTLLALYTDARRARQQQALLVARPAGAPVALPGRKLGRMSITTVEKRLKLFADSAYRAHRTEIQNLHPHRARKTFAKFVVMRDKRALESVANHFGHVYKSLTDGTYVGHDVELLDMLTDENEKELTRALTDLLTSEDLGGKASEGFKRMRADFPGKKGLNAMVDKLIRDGVAIAPCDWGYCIYVQAFSACKGDQFGPSEENREPNVCGGCQNFSVSLTHKSWWEERAKRERDFLQRSDLAEQTRFVVERRIQISETILRQLTHRKS